MGNSNGNLMDNWDFVREEPQVQGGFIWDWVDQGLVRRSEQKGMYWGYGGDFEPDSVYNDGNFCLNGLVYPDRQPHPGLNEVKMVYQPVHFSVKDTNEWQFEVYNKYFFTNLKQFEIGYKILENGEVVQDTKFEEITGAPQERKMITLNPQTILDACKEYFVWFYVQQKKAGQMLGKGHLIAENQIQVKAENCIKDLAANQPVDLEEKQDSIYISGERFFILFEKAHGLLTSYKFKGNQLVKGPLKNNFWRAPTDNDYGNNMPERCLPWKKATYNQKVEKLVVERRGVYGLQLLQTIGFENLESKALIRYTINDDGIIQTKVSFEYNDEDHAEMPPGLGQA